MRAIVLSAGQGKRLLPLTTSEPKCLLPVDGDRCVLEVQLRAIANCGIERASIFVGFAAERVEHFLETHPIPGLKVDAIYNADPETNPDAARYDRLTYAEAVRQNLQFMDQAAIAVCRENDVPIIVFDMTAPGNIRKVIAGEAIGTTVSG